MTDNMSPEGWSMKAGPDHPFMEADLPVADSRNEMLDTAPQGFDQSAGELIGLTSSQRFALPADLQQAAWDNPNNWLDEVDPFYRISEGEATPQWAIMRRWWSGPDGTIEGWLANPAYRPSPSTLGWPQPRDAVDEAVQLAACGYRTQEDVVLQLALARVAVLLGSDGAVLTILAEDGGSAVPVFTAADHLAAIGPFRADLVEAADLASSVEADQRILLNSTAAVPMMIEAARLREAVAALAPAPDEQRHAQDPGVARPTSLAADEAAASAAPDGRTVTADPAESGGMTRTAHAWAGEEMSELGDPVDPPQVTPTTMSADATALVSPQRSEETDATAPSTPSAARDTLPVGEGDEPADGEEGPLGANELAVTGEPTQLTGAAGPDQSVVERDGPEPAKQDAPETAADRVFQAIMGD